MIWSYVNSQVSSETDPGADEVDCCRSVVVTSAGGPAKIEVFSNDDGNGGLIYSHCIRFSILPPIVHSIVQLHSACCGMKS